MKSAIIRSNFLKYFEKNGHKAVPSDSLVPSGDPTLLFTSAGMVQFKKNFLGQSSDKFTRATTSQKCFRTSDIDQVGKTNRHLTFFEMLGNFSFGDYFKEDAIKWGWDFLTKEMGLNKEKLYATIFKDDNEAYELWKKIVPENKIIRMGEKTNFWNMGPTGPCGPCSEILLDLGPGMSCGKPTCGPDCDCERYLEVWNLVFTQFDRQEDGTLKNLPRKNIDTGMGLERLVAAANGKTNVFDTDLFTPLIEELAEMLDIEPSKNIPQLRMMADHARAVTMLISDGVLPSNEGRGYVLRRILRRALRQGKLLGASEPFLFKLAANVSEIMKTAYPELNERRENIASITKMEEEKFLQTLEEGTKILEDIMVKYRGNENKAKGPGKTNFLISGDEVFKLYDTYGFPLDLTREIAKENGLQIDEDGFNRAQVEAQSKSRAAWSGSGEKDTAFYSSIRKKTGEIEFIGYDKIVSSVEIIAIIKDGKAIETLKTGETGDIILSKTPFYPESGGQVGDTGILKKIGAEASVNATLKPVDGLIVHKVSIKSGSFNRGDKVEALVDIERRRSIMRHHTATHLLHKALRTVLGTHVTQAGSLVSPDHLRFDFTHFAAVKKEELSRVEEIVNSSIRADHSVCTDIMPISEAKKTGAMALFGEKYGETVRAVAVKEENAANFSLELCGGTHVKRTGEIGFFKIISESSVASGTRRIEAVAGISAEKAVAANERIIDELIAILKTTKDEIVEKAEKIISREKDLEKEISRLKSQNVMGNSDGILKYLKKINGINFLGAKVESMDIDSLKGLCDSLKVKIGSGVVLLATIQEEKLSFVVSATKDMVEKGVSSGKIAKIFASLISGSGGGKPEFAQGGGKDISGIDAALQKISETL